MKRVLLILCAIGFSHPAFAQLPKELIFGAADWCPYTCDTSTGNQPGIVQQYISKVLAKKGTKLIVKVQPWSRAVRDAENKKLDGLLTVVPGEAEGLTFTTTPTMSYQDCFYTRKDDSWTFRDKASLESIRFGAIQDYGYGEPIDSHIKQNKGVTLLNGDNLVKRLQVMLTTNRIDAFISERRVHSSEIQKAKLPLNEVRETSCLDEYPLFIAIQPDQPWSDELANYLNKALGSKDNKMMLKKIENTMFKAN